MERKRTGKQKTKEETQERRKKRRGSMVSDIDRQMVDEENDNGKTERLKGEKNVDKGMKNCQ